VRSPDVTCTLRHDVTLEGELNALAAVYRYILECHARKAAEPGPGPDGRDDVKESNGYVATEKYTS
jgi:hypothetical protein